MPELGFMSRFETDYTPDVHLDGTWYHFDARGAEPAVIHTPRGKCPLEHRHARSACGVNGVVTWYSKTY